MNNVVLVPVVAGVVLRKDDKFLLVEEMDPPHRGLWSLPGGRVEMGESIEQAALREAREETGFEVRLGRKLPIHQATWLRFPPSSMPTRPPSPASSCRLLRR